MGETGRALARQDRRGETQSVEQAELGTVVIGHRTVIVGVGLLQLTEGRDHFLGPVDQDEYVCEARGLPQAFQVALVSLHALSKPCLCLADADNELEVPFVATAEWGYLRLRRPDYNDSNLSDWAKRIAGQPWKEVFVFFKHEDAGKGPQFAMRFLELVGK